MDVEINFSYFCTVTSSESDSKQRRGSTSLKASHSPAPAGDKTAKLAAAKTGGSTEKLSKKVTDLFKSASSGHFAGAEKKTPLGRSESDTKVLFAGGVTKPAKGGTAKTTGGGGGSPKVAPAAPKPAGEEASNGLDTMEIHDVMKAPEKAGMSIITSTIWSDSYHQLVKRIQSEYGKQ